MEKLIVDAKQGTCCVLNQNNENIKCIILAKYHINNFDNLPNNVINKPHIFLREYELYDIDLKTIQDFLFANTITYSDPNYIYSLNNVFLYYYNQERKSLAFSFGKIWSEFKLITSISGDYHIYQQLFARLIEQHYIDAWIINSIDWNP